MNQNIEIQKGFMIFYEIVLKKEMISCTLPDIGNETNRRFI